MAAVTQNFQLAAIEGAVKVAQDGGAQEGFQRFNVVVEGREHHAPACGHFQLGQAVLFQLELFGHAAIDFAVLLDTTAKGHALQVAFDAVIPLVIGTQKIFGLAMTLAAKTHATVSAHVFNHIDAAIGVAHHDDRTLAHHGAAKVACVGDFSFQAHVTPVAVVEETIELFFVQIFAGVGPKRNATRALAFPLGFGWKYAGLCHESLAFQLECSDCGQSSVISKPVKLHKLYLFHE